MYRLTRDDGVELQVSGAIWEAALELAYLFGWRPLGTEVPRAGDWRSRRMPGAPLWDHRDYFSFQGQHVGHADARALAGAVTLSLEQIPDWDSPSRPKSVESAPTSLVPSRESAMAEGLSGSRRNLMRRLATFASRGGFTIGGNP